MYTHSDPEHKKSIHYMDPTTRVSRRECIAFANVINKPRIIKEHHNDWVHELGDNEDRNNIEALATWVSNQKDILMAKNRKRKIQLLRSRYKQTMENFLRYYLQQGLEKSDKH